MFQNKCRVCNNYLNGLERCKFCSFEWAEEYPPCNDDEWDILDLDYDIEWGHLQLIDRLFYKGIDCLSADIWWDNNLAIIIGCKASKSKVANALHISEKIIYDDMEHGLMILNLFQEKYLRGMLE